VNTELYDDEDEIRDSAANLQRGIETVGGWLYLTTQRLIFEAHALNIQSGRTVIPLSHIKDMWKSWTRFLGILPVFPNTLAVATKKGKTYRFVIGDRDRWIKAIRRAQRELEEEEED